MPESFKFNFQAGSLLFEEVSATERYLKVSYMHVYIYRYIFAYTKYAM